MKEPKYKGQAWLQPVARPLLIVLSSPSGAGKDAVLARLKQSGLPLEYITTVTTRPRRASERDNVDYHFIPRDQFEQMVKKDELLEWANVYGNWYGVPRPAVKQTLARGQDAIVKVDVQGATAIKKILPQAVFVFLIPPSKEELVTRLEQRRTESPAELVRRLEQVEEEIKQLSQFDYLVINRRDEIDAAVSDIKAIITAEKCRVAPREIAL